MRRLLRLLALGLLLVTAEAGSDHRIRFGTHRRLNIATTDLAALSAVGEVASGRTYRPPQRRAGLGVALPDQQLDEDREPQAGPVSSSSMARLYADRRNNVNRDRASAAR